MFEEITPLRFELMGSKSPEFGYCLGYVLFYLLLGLSFSEISEGLIAIV
jgi:hypothetical protein